jgi:SAM-dependent methyltransferase
MHDDRTRHWQDVYRSRDAQQVSWYRPHLDVSLALLRRAGLAPTSRVLDVGGGASTLVDDLLDAGVEAVTVLDLSSAALDVSRERIGARGAAVQFLAGDIARCELPAAAFSHWHDRAVLHFLHEADDVAAYARQARHALVAGGHAVIGGFAPDGPERCSGLPVARRSAQDMAALFGPAFELLHATQERHATPAGHEQSFAWAVLRKRQA